MKSLLRTKSLGVLLFLPIFGVLALLFFSHVGGHYSVEEEAYGVFDFLNISSSMWLALLVTMLIALIFFFQNERYDFFRQRSALPGLIFFVSILRFLPSSGMNPIIISSLVVAMAIYAMEGAIWRQKDNSPLFWLGFFVVVATAFYVKLILLIPWSLILLIFIGRFAIKDISALAIGWFSAAILIAFFLFMTDNFSIPLEEWRELFFDRDAFNLGSTFEMWRIGVLSLLILIFLFLSLTMHLVPVFAIRRIITSHAVLFVVLILSIFIFTGVTYDFLYVVFLPISWVISFYLFEYRMRIGGILFFLYILASLYPVIG